MVLIKAAPPEWQIHKVARLASVLIIFLRARGQGLRLEIILQEIIRYLVRLSTFEIRRVVGATAALVLGKGRIEAERPRAIDHEWNDWSKRYPLTSRKALGSRSDQERGRAPARSTRHEQDTASDI